MPRRKSHPDTMAVCDYVDKPIFGRLIISYACSQHRVVSKNDAKASEGLSYQEIELLVQAAVLIQRGPQEDRQIPDALGLTVIQVCDLT